MRVVNLTPARRVLLERGVSVSQIARETGLSHGVLAKIVNGNHRPMPRYVDALAAYLGIEVAELFPPDGES